MKLAEVLARHRASAGPRRLRASLGDGFLYEHNPVFRRVREAAWRSGFRFSEHDPPGYFGFPLVSLDAVLASRRIPYRDNVTALAALEASRPGFFELTDLKDNRPLPNFVLHESAHAVAFAALFGRPDDVAAAMAERGALVSVMLGESYAMTVEYFAACAAASARSSLHAWFFSISSYRHRTPKQQAVGRLLLELGDEPVIWVVLASFLLDNFLKPRLRRRDVERILSLYPMGPAPQLSVTMLRSLADAANGLKVMSLAFRTSTARLFLTQHGYGRNVRRTLAADPLELLSARPELAPRLSRMISVLAGS